MAKTLRLFTYNGDSYLGMTDATAQNDKISIDSPVKITFTYENASESSAKLSWLLTPIMPQVLIKSPTDVKLKNTVEFNKELVNFSTTLLNSNCFDTSLVSAYEGLTGEKETT